MTDRITLDKLTLVDEVIETLNKQLHPLVVKAILYDPVNVKYVASSRVCVLEDLLKHIQELIALVIEQ